VAVYKQLGRLDALQREYAKGKQAALHRFWYSYSHQVTA
jgi:hypothetical protein